MPFSQCVYCWSWRRESTVAIPLPLLLSSLVWPATYNSESWAPELDWVLLSVPVGDQWFLDLRDPVSFIPSVLERELSSPSKKLVQVCAHCRPVYSVGLTPVGIACMLCLAPKELLSLGRLASVFLFPFFWGDNRELPHYYDVFPLEAICLI